MSFQQFIAGFLGAGAIEILASISGFLCIYLLIKRSIWSWFFGFIQVSLYTYIFYIAKLYSDTGLHIIYMFLQVYGWWNWKHNKSEGNDLVIENGSLFSFLICWGVVLLATVVLGFTMDEYTDASFAYPDAFTTTASLVAQFLLSKRYWFNWIFWIIVDVVAVYIYLQKGLYPTAALYFTLLIMCFFGLYAWLTQSKTQNLESAKA
ncbi:nicotinamide riboside transporter PnuC [Glaciecola sp. 1036]|uniref:nicotinamide riboside transporter PnuC n=1 Tax=Alteromonadaceae TaxID=72275 RepID=UPI003CFE624F